MGVLFTKYPNDSIITVKPCDMNDTFSRYCNFLPSDNYGNPKWDELDKFYK